MCIYLDNSATTRPHSEVMAAMLAAMRQHYGNPSSGHSMGLAAERLMKKAREQTAAVINASPAEIYFTSGGTESVNLAVLGGANAKVGRHIVSTMIEHPAALQALKRLETEGFEISRLRPNEQGKIDLDEFKAALREDTSLVCVMHINNETGAVQPIRPLKGIMREVSPRALLFSDAVQSYGKLGIEPAEWGVDLLCASAHKLHGPKGAGLLYIRRGCTVRPLLHGGGQERGMRPGTENLPGIVGFGTAAALCGSHLARVKEMNALLKTGLLALDGAELNSPHDASPYILNLAFTGIRSEIMLNALSDRGIYVSSASACAGGRRSHVLTAMGKKNADYSIRFSLSDMTVTQEITRCVEACEHIIKSLRRR